MRFVYSSLRAGERRRGRERGGRQSGACGALVMRPFDASLFVTVRWFWAGVVLLVQKHLLTSTKVLRYCLGPVDSCLFIAISNCRLPRQLLQGINLHTTNELQGIHPGTSTVVAREAGGPHITHINGA